MIPAPLQNLFDRLAVAWHERAVALKAASFAVVGVVNSVIDFGVFSFCYYYLGLSIVVANTIAWVVAVSCSYVMNSTITFAAESGRRLHLKGYLGFALTLLGLQLGGLEWMLGGLLSTFVFAFVVYGLGGNVSESTVLDAAKSLK